MAIVTSASVAPAIHGGDRLTSIVMSQYSRLRACSRVAHAAEPSEVLVSQTVKDLVVGSGLVFEDRGEHELKGVQDSWRLYRVVGG